MVDIIAICCIEVKLGERRRERSHTQTRPHHRCAAVTRALKLKANQTINCHTLVKIVTLFHYIALWQQNVSVARCSTPHQPNKTNETLKTKRQKDRKRMENSNLVESKNEKWIFAVFGGVVYVFVVRSFFCGRRIPVKNVWKTVT